MAIIDVIKFNGILKRDWLVYRYPGDNFVFGTQIIGGRTPFTAEVIFINNTAKLDVFWGTTDPISLIDPKYSVRLRVRAFGQFGIRISDYRVFITELS